MTDQAAPTLLTAITPDLTSMYQSRCAPTISDGVPISGSTPTVVMTWGLVRDDADTIESTTKVVFEADFHPSTTPRQQFAADRKNKAAKQSFLESLESHKVTSGFQYLLKDTLDNATAFAVASHDPLKPLEAFLEGKLNTLSRSFGTLLKSNIEQALSSELSNPAPRSHPRRRSRPLGHVAITPVERSLWKRLASIENEQDALAGQRTSTEARKGTFRCVYRIMHNELSWDGERSPWRGYWKSEDGTLVEIHPEFLGVDPDDPEGGPLSLSDRLPDGPRQDSPTGDNGNWHEPRFAQKDDGAVYDQFRVLPPGIVPTLRTRSPHTSGTTPFTSGTTPFVVYKGEFKQLGPGEHRRMTAFVIQAEYIQSVSGNATNAAARKTFLRGFDRKVAAGFQHTLNSVQNSMTGRTLGFRYPTNNLGIYDEGVTKGILHTFGNLMKSSIGASSDRSGMGSYKDVRKAKPRLADHLAISPATCREWDVVTGAGDQQKNLAQLPKSRVASEKANPRVYRIMHDQEVMDASEGPLRAYWTNADGALLEINPKDWATNTGEDERSRILSPFGTIAARSGMNRGMNSPLDVGGDEGDWGNEGRDGVVTNETHNHGDMSWRHEDSQGSYQQSVGEETYDGVPEDSDEVYIGSYYSPATWAQYLAPLEEYCRDFDTNMEAD
jgi:hypothetical protein